MFPTSALFLFAAAGMAGVYGLATSVAEVLARWLPGFAYGIPRWAARLGGSDAWQSIVYPILASPCWVPFLTLGLIFMLLGIVRRV